MYKIYVRRQQYVEKHRKNSRNICTQVFHSHFEKIFKKKLCFKISLRNSDWKEAKRGLKKWLKCLKVTNLARMAIVPYFSSLTEIVRGRNAKRNLPCFPFDVFFLSKIIYQKYIVTAMPIFVETGFNRTLDEFKVKLPVELRLSNEWWYLESWKFFDKFRIALSETQTGPPY